MTWWVILAFALCVLLAFMALIVAFLTESPSRAPRARPAEYVERGDRDLEQQLLETGALRVAQLGDGVMEVGGRVAAQDDLARGPLSGRAAVWGRVHVFALRTGKRTGGSTANPMYYELLGCHSFGGAFEVEDEAGDRVRVEPAGARLLPAVQHVWGPGRCRSAFPGELGALFRSAGTLNELAGMKDVRFHFVEEIVAVGEDVRVLGTVNGAAAKDVSYRTAPTQAAFRAKPLEPLVITTSNDEESAARMRKGFSYDG